MRWLPLVTIPWVSMPLVLTHCGNGSDTPQAAIDSGVATDTGAEVAPPEDAPPSPSFCGEPVTTSWRRCAKNPLYLAGHTLPDGMLELSVGDPDVQWDPDDKLWKAWWSAGASKSYGEKEKAAVHIRYAESKDGLAWTVQAEPVLRSRRDPTNWDDTQIETPTVVKVPGNPPDRRWVMFYAAGNDADYPYTAKLEYTWYQIGVAFSADGKSFTRMPASESPYFGKSTGFRNVEGLLLLGRDAFPGLAGVENGVVADPEIVFDGKDYHLFFSSLASKADRTSYLAYGVSHAKLTSLSTPRLSVPSGNPVLVGAAQPSVIRTEAGYEVYVIYDSAEDTAKVPSVFNPYYGIWKHTSADLVSFSGKAAAHDFSMEGADPAERYGMIKAGDMTYLDGVRRYYYPAFRSEGVPPGFFAPLRLGSVPVPAGGIEDKDAGLLYAPAVIGLHVAARR